MKLNLDKEPESLIEYTMVHSEGAEGQGKKTKYQKVPYFAGWKIACCKGSKMGRLFGVCWYRVRELRVRSGSPPVLDSALRLRVTFT